MKRIRQIIVALWVCFIWAALSAVPDLWQSKWLIEMHNECEPIFLTFFVTLGVFLLLAARKPIQFWLVIAFAAWHSLAHSATMLIQTVEAYRHGTPRDDKDVIGFGMIGIVMLLMVPSKEEVAAIA